MYHLKPLSKDAVQSALAKAERYRFLNEPGEAESICLDVLAVDAHNQSALITLLLALTDQFGAGSSVGAHDWIVEAMKHFERAEWLRPSGNDDARLRWNACARFLDRHPH